MQPFQDISVVEGWQVQAAAWGPHVLSLRNTPPPAYSLPQSSSDNCSQALFL